MIILYSVNSFIHIETISWFLIQSIFIYTEVMDLVLFEAEFAKNRYKNSTTRTQLGFFQVVGGQNHWVYMTWQVFLVLGFKSVKVEDTIEYFRKVHDQVKHETIDSNAKYKAFVAGRSPLKLEIWCELCLLVINFL